MRGWFLILFLLTLGCLQGMRLAGADRPNILWICTDQQRWDTIQALNNPHLRTPHLNRLAADGVAFTHAFVQSTVCTPSRASFLTGMYPSTLHAAQNGNAHWADAAPLVTKLLADAGYDCGLAGKFHLSSAQGRIEPRIQDGYRVFHWSHHPKDDWPEGNAYIKWLKAKGQDYNALKKRHGYIPTPFHQTTWCTEMAIDFLNEKRSGPWLFSLNCFDPHGPFDPPAEFRDRFQVEALPGPLFRKSDLAQQRELREAGVQFQKTAVDPATYDARAMKASYWAQIELIDRNLGRLLKALEESGQRDNTLVIFTSDHGEMLGDHGLRQKGCRFYEGLVRVPLLVSWPRRAQAGRQCEALVELVDIAPTLLEAAGVPAPRRMQGRSLMGLLTGSADPAKHREYVRCEYYAALQGPPTYATMIRTRDHKLIAYHGLGVGELYDLKRDPDEFNNLWQAPGFAEIRSRLLQLNFDALARAVDVGSERVGRY